MRPARTLVSKAIEELIDDHELRERLGKMARDRVAVYSLECMGDGFEQVIRKSLGPKGDNCR